MAVIIYNNTEMRNALNKITFKYVVDSINMQINIAKQFKYKYIVVDVPLLYEAKMENICDYVIAVIAEDEEKIARICERDKITEDDAKKRLRSQNSNEFFAKKADFVVYNNGSFEELENSLKEIIEKI